MNYCPQTTRQTALEASLSALAKQMAYTGLIFGYIGNFERWGDDRELRIWDNEGNTLWKCEAIRLDRQAFDRAVNIILERT